MGFLSDVTDHGGLGGLLDDDHPQYALLAGRVGGQILYGGNAANDDLTLVGTSHGTKDSSFILLQPTGGRVGIGGSPQSKGTVLTGVLHIITDGVATGIDIQAATDSNSQPTLILKDHNAVDRLYLGLSQGPDNFLTGTVLNDLVLMAVGGGKLHLSSNSVPTLTVTGGKVGIGTVSPQQLLHISDQVTGSAQVIVDTNTAGVCAINWHVAGVAKWGAVIADSLNTDLLFYDGSKSILRLVRGGPVCMDAGLHVGGTSDPGDNNLLVDGNATISGSVINAIALPTSAAGLATGDLWVDTTGGLNIVKRV